MTRSRSAALAALLVGCTTPYVVDAGPDAPRRDAAVDAPVDASAADGGTDAPDACVARCSSGGLDVCGEVTACPLGCLEAPTPHCARMVVSNVDAALAGLTVSGDVVVVSDETIDTTSCTWSLPLGPMPAIVSTDDGPEVCLLYVRSLAIAASGSLRGAGSRPLVIVAEGSITVDGDLSVDSLQASGGTYDPGAGAGSGGTAGLDGIRVMTLDSGGGGGGFGGAGGNGGDVMPGATGGMGGASTTSSLVPLVGGGNGGDATGGSGVTPGAPSGGALQLSAQGAIRITGYVGASGAGGRSAAAGAGAGGGSGGGVLIEAPVVMLGGRLNLSGGGGASGTCFGTGQAGQDGAGRTDQPQGGGGACGTGGRGGDGAGSSVLVGEPGGSSTNNGGGGGGGAGRARLRALTPPDLAGAALNPRFDASIYVTDTITTR